MRYKSEVTLFFLFMKKTISSLLAISSIAMGALPDGWEKTFTEQSVTYTTTQVGTFTLADLGDAAIKNGESFSLTMEFSCTTNPFNQNKAISFIAAKNGSESDLYDIGGGDDQFRFYVRTSDKFVQFSINGENITGFGGLAWNVPAISDISAANPVSIGLTFTYVNAKDAPDGNDYYTISSTPGSQIAFDTFRKEDITKSFNFSDLTNATGYAAAPSGMITKVSITKNIPEPATATLSLLALVGLAARRRRK